MTTQVQRHALLGIPPPPNTSGISAEERAAFVGVTYIPAGTALDTLLRAVFAGEALRGDPNNDVTRLRLVVRFKDVAANESHSIVNAGSFAGNETEWRAPVAARITIVAYEDDGSSRIVRFANAALPATQQRLIVADHEACPFRTTVYKARATADIGGLAFASEEGTSVEVISRPTSARIKNPWLPDTDIAVRVTARSLEQPLSSYEFAPRGQTKKHVDYDEFDAGVEGDVSVAALDTAQHDALKALLTSRQTLLLQPRKPRQWYVRPSGSIHLEELRAAPLDTELTAARDAHYLTFRVVEHAAP